jgi:hypothetical protein
MSEAVIRDRDVERLNRVIAAGLRFRIRRDHGRTGAVGVLIAKRADGTETIACRELDVTGSGRSRLLAVASCLAECAMELGLGARACLRSEDGGSAAPPETP